MDTKLEEGKTSKEAIPSVVQNKILALCGTAGMHPDQLMILHHILRNFDKPEIKATAEILGTNSGAPDRVRDDCRRLLEQAQ